MNKKAALLVIALVFIILAAGYFGRHITFALQWPLFEALRTTASIIFAVVGAWFAIIYPERLKKSFHGSGEARIALVYTGYLPQSYIQLPY